MRFDELLHIVGDEPVFETGLLLAGDVDAGDVRRQLSRWCAAGRIVQLRRGLYALAPPYRRREPDRFLVANRLVAGSYVSLESALSAFGLIPEHVPVVTSVTTHRPGRWDTPLGSFLYQHIGPRWLHGYRTEAVSAGQTALIATPEKALLDLVYLTPGGDTLAYLAELRLQNLDRLDLATLNELASRSGKPKLRRAAAAVRSLADSEAMDFVTA
jgi:predicted transcriptional regulator of viral defense system